MALFETIYIPGENCLHIAPEKKLKQYFKKQFKRYKTLDLYMKRVDINASIEKIPLRSNSQDFILCSHVLEHVDNDIKAIKELSRVLKKGGIMFILIPQSDIPTTYEDKSITEDWQRKRVYGREDHKRLYGYDFADRLRSCGLRVKVESSDFRSAIEKSKNAFYNMSCCCSGENYNMASVYFQSLNLPVREDIFVCEK